jgi:hypothetical protein
MDRMRATRRVIAKNFQRERSLYPLSLECESRLGFPFFAADLQALGVLSWPTS